MEILTICSGMVLTIMFKIDLIVWKFIYSDYHLFNPQMFKIDLIVWKLCWGVQSMV